MNKRYVCQSAEGNRYETFDNVKECLELMSKGNLFDEGDEICLEQALYRVVDGKLEEVDNED